MELTRTKKLISFEKAALVAARFGGHNWEVEDVGIVLDVRDTRDGERHLTVITQRGVIVSMKESQAGYVFHLLGDKADAMFVRMYLMMSHWQIEEDHDAGQFEEAFKKARSMLAAENTIRMVSLKSAFGDL